MNWSRSFARQDTSTHTPATRREEIADKAAAELREDEAVSEARLALVLDEYEEMPGLSLSLEQAQRLWHLDGDTCRRILDKLVAVGYLRLSPYGYVRV